MKRPEEYIVTALMTAQNCATIQQAVEAGSEFGGGVAAQVVAHEKRTRQTNDAHRIGLEDAFQHALNLAEPRSVIQSFLDSALSALTDELRGQTS